MDDAIIFFCINHFATVLKYREVSNQTLESSSNSNQGFRITYLHENIILESPKITHVEDFDQKW